MKGGEGREGGRARPPKYLSLEPPVNSMKCVLWGSAPGEIRQYDLGGNAGCRYHCCTSLLRIFVVIFQMQLLSEKLFLSKLLCDYKFNIKQDISG